MKAVTLYQPHATLVAIGAKRIETRSWSTNYRGPLAIHASKKFSGKMKLAMFRQPFFDALKKEPYFEMEGTLPTGVIVAICNLTEVFVIPPYLFLSDQERAFGDYTPGRFMWMLADIQRLAIRPVVKGAMRLWEWEGNHG